MRCFMCWLSVLLLLTACHDDVIPSPMPAVPVPPAGPPGPAPMATFVADPAGTAPGVRVIATEIMGPDTLELAVETWPAERLNAVDVLFSIDPASRAQFGLRPATWCNTQAPWSSTANPGEWLIRRIPEDHDVDCRCPEEPGTFALARLQLIIPEPGTWRIEVRPATATPVCDCELGCPSNMGFYGGTIHVAAP